MLPQQCEPGADEALVARIRAGDRSAEADLVARYSRGLMNVIRRSSPDNAEDIHQECFRVLIERLRDRGLEEPDKLGRFLLRIAHNLTLRAWRDASRRPVSSFGDLIDTIPEPSPGPYAQLANEELAQCVRLVISELRTERDRAILHRFYIVGDDKEQICAELDLDSLHFNRVLFRARERFRQLLLARKLFDPEEDHESR